MDTTHDGGPAFGGTRTEKVPTDDGRSHDWIDVKYSGMSLLDYFAAKALPEAIRHALAIRENRIKPDDFNFDRVAMTAYEMGRAMLRARAQSSPQSPGDTMRAHLAEFGK